MKHLASYLKDTGTSQAEFAAAVGVKQPTVHRWLNGARPSWDKAAEIECATGGQVSVSMWANTHSVNPSSVAPSSEAAQPEVSCLPEKRRNAANGVQVGQT